MDTPAQTVTETVTETAALSLYEARLQPHRDIFANAPAFAFLGGAVRETEILHLFLLHYAAFGIEMTRPVEGWIRRAGEKCHATGLTEIGKGLMSHAAHEAGHEKLMIADVWALAERWNAHHAHRIDPIALARDGLPQSVRDYHALHDALTAGDAAFAQIAVEYEIEALSVRHGPALVASADGLLGGSGAEGCSFLREHVALDAAHTEFNRRQIARLLAGRPDCLDALVDAGARALEVYGRFIADCLKAALTFDANETGDALTCRLFAPPGRSADPAPPEWLVWLRALRSHILFADGARPAFGPGGRAFGDADPVDLDCHHLILFDGDLPVGAARLSLPADLRWTGQMPGAVPVGQASIVETTFGAKTVNRCLASHGLQHDSCAEASRLVLHPRYRGGRAVRRLLAGLWALAADAGAPAILAAAGTASHQDRLFAIFGAEILEDAGRVDAPEFCDTLGLAMFMVDTDAPPDYPELAHMQEFVRRAKREAGATAFAAAA